MEIKDSVRKEIMELDPHFANLNPDRISGEEFIIQFDFLKSVCSCKSCST